MCLHCSKPLMRLAIQNLDYEKGREETKEYESCRDSGFVDWMDPSCLECSYLSH